jgi:Protein of unknown function (DUF3082)
VNTVCCAISKEQAGGAELAPFSDNNSDLRGKDSTASEAAGDDTCTTGDDTGSQQEDGQAITTTTTAAIGTVNQRLLAELEAARELEKNGPRSTIIPIPKAVTTIFGAQRKSDEERRAAIAQARDLNGVNPFTALLGSVVALAGSIAFWQVTDLLAEYFAMHPDDPDQLYVVSRLAAVGRNVAIGLSALASGFFGVTGLGILLLGLRVLYGVIVGELDPTPKAKDGSTASGQDTKIEIQEMWKLMTNQSKKRGQR